MAAMTCHIIFGFLLIARMQPMKFNSEPATVVSCLRSPWNGVVGNGGTGYLDGITKHGGRCITLDTCKSECVGSSTCRSFIWNPSKGTCYHANHEVTTNTEDGMFVSGDPSCDGPAETDPTGEECQLFSPSALSWTASQSSQSIASPTATAGKCIDGNFNTMCSTKTSSSPWWQADMQESMEISKIRVKNRLDRCSSRATCVSCNDQDCSCSSGNAGVSCGLQVWVGDSSNESFKQTGTECGLFTANSYDVSEFEVICHGPVTGRYVTISLPGSNRIVNLKEVEFYGFQTTTTTTTATVHFSVVLAGIYDTFVCNDRKEAFLRECSGSATLAPLPVSCENVDHGIELFLKASGSTQAQAESIKSRAEQSLETDGLDLPNFPPLMLQTCATYTCITSGSGANTANLASTTVNEANCCQACSQDITYSSNGACNAVSTCTLGESYETKAATLTSDRECTNVRESCPVGHVQTANPTLTSDRACDALCTVPTIPAGVQGWTGTNCSSGATNVVAGTTCTITALPGYTCTSPGLCQSNGQFEASGACQALCTVPNISAGVQGWTGTNCASGATNVVAGTTCNIIALSGFTCTSPGLCQSNGQFEASGACQACIQDNTYSNNGVCESVSTCTQGSTYQSAAPTLTSDRVCTDVTTCPSGSVQVAAPTLTSNRICKATWHFSVVLTGQYDTMVGNDRKQEFLQKCSGSATLAPSLVSCENVKRGIKLFLKASGSTKAEARSIATVAEQSLRTYGLALPNFPQLMWQDVTTCSTDKFAGHMNFCHDWCNVTGKWGCGRPTLHGGDSRNTDDLDYTCLCTGCNGCSGR